MNSFYSRNPYTEIGILVRKFLWILDLGLGFGTWLWDLDLGLGLDLTIIRIIIQREDFEFMCWQVVVQDNSVPAPVRFGLLIWVLDLTWVGF